MNVNRKKEKKNKYNNDITYVNPTTLACLSSDAAKEHIDYNNFIRFDSRLEANTYTNILNSLNQPYLLSAHAAKNFQCFVFRHPKISLMRKIAQGDKKVPEIAWIVDFLIMKVAQNRIVNFLFIESKGYATEAFKIKLRLFEHCFQYKYGIYATNHLAIVSQKKIRNESGIETFPLNKLNDYLYRWCTYDSYEHELDITPSILYDLLYPMIPLNSSLNESLESTILDLSMNTI